MPGSCKSKTQRHSKFADAYGDRDRWSVMSVRRELLRARMPRPGLLRHQRRGSAPSKHDGSNLSRLVSRTQLRALKARSFRRVIAPTSLADFARSCALSQVDRAVRKSSRVAPTGIRWRLVAGCSSGLEQEGPCPNDHVPVHHPTARIDEGGSAWLRRRSRTTGRSSGR